MKNEAKSNNLDQETAIQELFEEEPYPEEGAVRVIRGFPHRARRAHKAIERSTPTTQAKRSDRTPPGPSHGDAERSVEFPRPAEQQPPSGRVRPRDAGPPGAVDAAPSPVDAACAEAAAEVPAMAVAVAATVAEEDASPTAATSLLHPSSSAS